MNFPSRWRPLLGVTFLLGFGLPPAARGERLELSPAELAWVRANPVIAVGFDPAFPPFSYRGADGRLAGLDRELLDLLGKRIGVEFTSVPAADWSEAFARARTGEIPVLVGTAETPERARDFRFTRPYISFPMAVVTRSDAPPIRSLDALRDRRVAGAPDYVTTDALRRDYPDIELTLTADMTAAFLAVARGEADAAATNIAHANFIIQTEGLTTLKVAGIMPYLFQLRLAVHRDQPELHALLDRAIATLTPAERQALIAPWVRVDFEGIVSRAAVLRWAGIALVIAAVIAALAWWHQCALRIEIARRVVVQRELEAVRDHLAATNEEKAGLMRMAAHDLRNPLTGILLNLDLLRLQAGAVAAEPVDRIVLLVHQMLHMIRNLLDVQTLEDGSRKFRPEPMILGEAVAETVASLEPLAARKHIVIVPRLAADLPAVRADRAALRQVLDNLLSNAVKFSPSDARVAIRASVSADRIRIEVRDQGPGVRPEEMDRLFQKYSLLSARPTGGEQSTGLGLAIVKQLVTRMEGRVWCEPADPANPGACFRVELPRAEAPKTDA